jgi:hypothetical protein
LEGEGRFSFREIPQEWNRNLGARSGENGENDQPYRVFAPHEGAYWLRLDVIQESELSYRSVNISKEELVVPVEFSAGMAEGGVIDPWVGQERLILDCIRAMDVPCGGR